MLSMTNEQDNKAASYTYSCPWKRQMIQLNKSKFIIVTNQYMSPYRKINSVFFVKMH